MTITRRRLLGFLGAAVFLTGCSLFLPLSGDGPRILLVGDSWAQGIWMTHTMPVG